MNKTIDFKIFGLGKAGSSVVKQLIKEKVPPERLFYFDTDGKDIASSGLSNRFLVGGLLTKEKGTNGDMRLAKEIFLQERPLFDKLTVENCLYILIGGLGAGTFSGLAAELANSLLKQGKKIILITSLPPEHEGKERLLAALDVLKQINECTDKLILASKAQSRKMFNDQGKSVGFLEIDKQFAEIVRCVLVTDHVDIIQGATKADEHMFDGIALVKAYVQENELFVAQNNSDLVVANTHKALMEAIRDKPEIVHTISPRKFEELIAYIYKLAGYTTELTAATRDDGIDIKVWTLAPVGNPFLTVIQAKQKKEKPVGSAAVRELHGAKWQAGADKAALVTTTTFSADAIKTARNVKVDLIRFYELTEEYKKLRENKI